MTRYCGAAALLAALWIGVAGCSGKEADGRKDGKTAGRHPVAVEVTRVVPADLSEGIDVTGSLSPKFSAEIKSEIGGVVAEVYVTEWVRVRKGEPLARVDTREPEVLLRKARAAVELARANLLEAEAAGRRAEREYERALKLMESGLMTRQGQDDALTQREAAAARIAAAKAQVRAADEDVLHAGTRIEKAVIRSPFDGIVAERLVNAGDLVGEMQKIIFRVVDNRFLDLTVNVPSGKMEGVRVGQPLAFTTDAVSGKTFAGTVRFINPVVSDADRSVRVVAEVRNVPEVLKGGLFVKGRIVTGLRKGILQIPRAALLTWDVPGMKGELFAVDNNTALRRAVATGAVSEDRVEVVSGLPAGALVVTRGGFNLRDGDAVTIARVNGDR